jgi:hypothetical protein
MDIPMPVTDGLDATARILAADPATRLLMEPHARDRAQLIIVADESGLVTPQSPAA